MIRFNLDKKQSFSPSFKTKIMEKIEDIQIGHTFENPRNGKGMITGKTKRTLTATFENGNIVKNTYKYSDAYFYSSEF